MQNNPIKIHFSDTLLPLTNAHYQKSAFLKMGQRYGGEREIAGGPAAGMAVVGTMLAGYPVRHPHPGSME